MSHLGEKMELTVRERAHVFCVEKLYQEDGWKAVVIKEMLRKVTPTGNLEFFEALVCRRAQEKEPKLSTLEFFNFIDNLCRFGLVTHSGAGYHIKMNVHYSISKLGGKK